MKEINKVEFNKLLDRIEKILTGEDFPQKVLADKYEYAILFDFETVFSEDLFSVIKGLMERTTTEIFYLLVAEPNPFSYFFKSFNRLPVISISRDLSFKEYIAALNADPGGSPADALIFNSSILYIVSEDLDIIYFFDRKNEIGIGYFSERSTYEYARSIHKFGVIDTSDQETMPSFLIPLIEKFRDSHFRRASD